MAWTMGQINDFANQQFTAALRPGEVLLLMGIGSMPDREMVYAVLGATTQRLLVLRLPAGAWMNEPKPEALSLASLEYAQLGESTGGPTKTLHGPAKRLALKGAGGDIALVLMEEHKSLGRVWNYEGFDDHREFYDVYPEWIGRHVTAGSFRSQQGADQALAELQHARAMRTQSAQQAQQAAATARIHASIKWPYFLMVMSLLVAGLGVFIYVRMGNQVRVTESGIAAIRTAAETPNTYMHANPERAQSQIAEEEARIAEFKSSATMGIALMAAGPVGAVAFLLLGMRLNKQKRARLAAAGAG